MKETTVPLTISSLFFWRESNDKIGQSDKSETDGLRASAMAGEQEQPQRVRSDGEPMQLDRLVHDTSAEPVGVSAASDEEVVSVKQHANGGDLAVDNEEPEQDASSKKCAFCPTKKVSAGACECELAGAGMRGLIAFLATA